MITITGLRSDNDKYVASYRGKIVEVPPPNLLGQYSEGIVLALRDALEDAIMTNKRMVEYMKTLRVVRVPHDPKIPS